MKSREEVQRKNETAQAQISEIDGKRKRGPSEGTEARQAARKQQQLEARAGVLALPTPVGGMTTLWERGNIQK
jgi:hypothetical protein